MTNQSRLCAGATLGAIFGGAVAYFLFTEHGRTVRSRFDPAVDELVHGFEKVRGAVEKIGGMANEGLRTLKECQSSSEHDFPSGRTAH